MRFSQNLISARLVKRYKRFLADVIIDETGEQVTAHCANPGAMLGLQERGARVWLSVSDNPKRKLKYSWELMEVNGVLVGMNTLLPNRIVEESLREGLLPMLEPFEEIRREVKYGEKSRVDFLLIAPDGGSTYVEVKNVHLMRTLGLAEFPDSVTTRGAKHLQELASMALQGARAVMIYLVQRPDCNRFTLAGDLDPAYAKAFKQARECGVEAYCLGCDVTRREIRAARLLPVEM